MKINHKQFAVASVLLLVLDYLWLSFFMGKQYRPLILKIQKSPMEINYISAIISYSFMILGLYQFVYKYISSNYPFIISAVSGYSGGGKDLIKYFKEEDHEPFFTYGHNLDHKHLP